MSEVEPLTTSEGQKWLRTQKKEQMCANSEQTAF